MSQTDPIELDEIIAVALRMQAEAREVDPATVALEDIGPEWFEAAAAEVAARKADAAVAALPPAPAPAPAPPPLSTASVWGFAVALLALFSVCGAGVAVLVGATEVLQAQQRVDRTQQEAAAALDAEWSAQGATRDPSVPLDQQLQALGTDDAAATAAVERWRVARVKLKAAAAKPPGAWACAVGLVACP